MANVSFAKEGAANPPETYMVETPVEGVTVECTHGGGPAVEAAPVTRLAVATRPPAGPVSPLLPGGDVLPDVTDIIVPRLNIVQKVGELSNIFEHGAILFDQKSVIYECPTYDRDGKQVTPGSAPLEIVVIGFRAKRFIEKTEFSAGERGLICKSEADVVACGGTLSYQEHELKKAEGMRLFQPLSEALVIVFKPESFVDESGTIFGFDCGGRSALIALWGMKGSSYTKGAKVFFTARQMGCLRTGYPAFSFNWSTRLEKFGTGNSAYVPVLTPKTKSSDAVLDFARQVVSGSAS